VCVCVCVGGGGVDVLRQSLGVWRWGRWWWWWWVGGGVVVVQKCGVVKRARMVKSARCQGGGSHWLWCGRMKSGVAEFEDSQGGDL